MLLAGLLVGHALAPGLVARYVCYTGAALVAAAVMRGGIGRHRPAARGWRWLEAGLWLHGGYGASLLAQAVLPGAAWLAAVEKGVDGAAHLAMVAAAVDFVAVRRPGQRRAGLLDAAAALLAAVAYGWWWMLDEVLGDGVVAQGIAVATALAAGLLVYAAAVIAARAPEALYNRSVIARRLYSR